MAGSSVTGERVSAVVGNARRRFALYYLLSNEYTDIDSLSVQIAAWEEGETVTSVDETARQRVKIALHHNHLPRLESHDVVEFDPRNGDVVRSAGFDDVRPIVERLRDADEETAQPGGAGATVDGERLASNL